MPQGQTKLPSNPTTNLDYEITKLTAEESHAFIYLVVSNSEVKTRRGKKIASIGGFDTSEPKVVDLLERLLRLKQ